MLDDQIDYANQKLTRVYICEGDYFGFLCCCFFSLQRFGDVLFSN